MPIYFTYTSSTHGMMRVQVFSKVEIMAHWTAVLRGHKESFDTSSKCYEVKNLSMADAVVITALWLRKINTSLLIDTSFDPKNNILYLSVTGIARASGRLAGKDIAIRDILSRTGALIDQCLCTEDDLTKMEVDDQGAPLFDAVGV